ncbi:UDP-N-acetylmuramoylalanine--D-glutamate ligase [Chlamydiales bacterium STE3]|nr:UDP-N-acetylmuramoylalanine--D-glutamate ligase [Chlamydiales bacterium STE3]
MSKTLIIGMGISGQAAARLLLSQGQVVLGVDSRYSEFLQQPEILELISKGLQLQSDKDTIFFGDIDLVIVSPGLSVKHPLYIAAKGENKKVIGEIELGCRYLTGQKVIGITGTNGKTTVTLLIEHILNFAGKKAIALGNVGTALCSKIQSLTAEHHIILELSSYQLETFNQKVLDLGVLLNITPDHLDRYGTMEAYAKAKINIQKCLKNEGQLFVEEKTYKQFETLFLKEHLHCFGYDQNCIVSTNLDKIFYNNLQEYPLPRSYHGKPSLHLENLLAACSVCLALGVTFEEIFKSLSTFNAPQHRVQFVREIHGVSYYDDSKGTNVEAVKRAVELLPPDVILIAGGIDKGESYAYWLEGFKNKVKCICAIGQAKDKIKENLHPSIEVLTFNDLKEAVIYASSVARPKDSILLSPGCASYDMFRDFAHRGKEFQSIVNSLV